MENVRKRVNIEVLQAPAQRKKIRRLIAKPTFKRFVIFGEGEESPEEEILEEDADGMVDDEAMEAEDEEDDSFKTRCIVGVENRKVAVTLNKPVYIGMCVLDLSKHLMYDFFYNHLKKKYADKVKLLYTDTDSVIIQVETADIYEDMKSTASEYDTSNYAPDHPLFSNENKKVVGKMKDELGGKIMKEFIGLRSKMYSYTGEESGKRAKGVKKAVLKKTITHDDYKECLLNQQLFRREMTGLRSHGHQIYGESVQKLALSPLDTKRYILSDGINTLAFGHSDI